MPPLPPQTVQCTVLKVIPFSLPCIHLHTDVLYFWVNLSVNTNFSYEAIWVKFIFISFFSLFPLSLLFNYAYTLYIVIFLHVDSLLYNNACIHDMNTCTPFSLLSPPPYYYSPFWQRNMYIHLHPLKTTFPRMMKDKVNFMLLISSKYQVLMISLMT